MDIMYYVSVPFGIVMKWCWQLVGNYGLAILLFTLATKVILLPVSVWIQKNSILMVKIQPEINFIKARLSGNMDAIADEQSKLFKREHYHPMLAVVALLLQLFLLLAVIEIIYHPITFLFGIDSESIALVANHLGLNVGDSTCQTAIIQAIKNGTVNADTVIAGLDSQVLAQMVADAQNFRLDFLGFDLSVIPVDVWGLYILVPVLAGLSSWLMCWTQNMSNVIQHEQGKLNQYGIMAFSVALSLYLGLFVPAGIALYWVLSNLMSIGQMYLLNLAINPKKYVDYEALEQSRVALAESKAFGQIDKKDPLYKQMKKREKADYKAFKHVANKHVVVYSEKS
ncbi:MAG: membrane protein insertase YidC, partial [Clostridia bacterium]|nr:membrane protein insertase YidC [Clostridia bacterium]